MYPLSDKDLDRLSRDAAEHYDVEQNTSGWDNLEQRLNKELPIQKDKDRRRFLWFLLLLVMVTGGGLFVMLQKNSSPEIATTISSNTEQTTPSNNKEQSLNKDQNNKDQNSVAVKEEDPETPVDNLSTTNSDKKNITSIEKNSTAKDQTTAINNQVKQSSNKVSVQQTQKANNKISNKYNSAKQPKNNNQLKSSEIAKTDNQDLKNQDLADNKDESVRSNEDVNKPIQKAVPPVAIKKEDVAVAEKNADDKKADDKKVEKKNAAKTNSGQNKSRFAIGLLTGIDKSSIHSVGTDKFGYSLGLTGQYNISKRWAVSTGLIYTKKQYSAMGEDYHPPKHYWTYYVDLDKLSGNCEMLEIPINLRYNINLNTKSQWFASAGISSYLMKNQNYTYFYKFMGQYNERDWTNSRDTSHLFSILNLSAGFERSIGKNLSLQAEPYVKLPLSGIGYGQMDINSYGLYLTLKYSPTKKTTASKQPK